MKKKIHFFLIVLWLVPVAGSTQVQNSALKILPDGKVGIGTETPTEKLQVEGNLKINGRIMDKTGVVMPVGTILPYAGSIAPAGWLLCDGASYEKSGDKKELFAVIGGRYGVDGNKFKLPDLRSTFIMGANPGDSRDSLGSRGAADSHYHKIQLPVKTFVTTNAGSHIHKFPSQWYSRNLATPGLFDKNYSGIDAAGAIENQTTQEAGNHSHSVEVAFPEVNTSRDNKNRPKWIALNYIIKY